MTAAELMAWMAMERIREAITLSANHHLMALAVAFDRTRQSMRVRQGYPCPTRITRTRVVRQGGFVGRTVSCTVEHECGRTDCDFPSGGACLWQAEGRAWA